MSPECWCENIANLEAPIIISHTESPDKAIERPQPQPKSEFHTSFPGLIGVLKKRTRVLHRFVRWPGQITPHFGLACVGVEHLIRVVWLQPPQFQPRSKNFLNHARYVYKASQSVGGISA